ncbi:hypothetical protein MNBD_UNCLBAC01-27 [hydrothermal vent metagenome]|uniref:Type II secretion system protein n=1 Tax=hydrothermal vent metagenome TaxID=652676 RepID=A0A3B1DH32_9ZZZZ
MEVLIVTSLIAMVSATVYSMVTMGVKVWRRNQQLVIEEDVAIFFDKLSRDLRNTFVYSHFSFEGGEQKISFPTMVHTLVDRRSGGNPNEYHDQMGLVKYSYDGLTNILYRQQANYSQALNKRFVQKQSIVQGIEKVRFRYFYLTENREIFSSTVRETYPSIIEVEVEFEDQKGRRKMNKLIKIEVENYEFKE